LLSKDQDEFSESNQIWSSKIFHFLEETTNEISTESTESFENSLNALKPHLSELNLTPELIKEGLKQMSMSSGPTTSITTTTDSRITEIDTARIQIYSLYLGLQPLTRFLKSNEVYDALFRE